MKITRLSENQRFVFRWWTARELSDYDGIICDGAVRSGKTFCLSASFMTWAMTNFGRVHFWAMLKNYRVAEKEYPACAQGVYESHGHDGCGGHVKELYGR